MSRSLRVENGLPDMKGNGPGISDNCRRALCSPSAARHQMGDKDRCISAARYPHTEWLAGRSLKLPEMSERPSLAGEHVPRVDQSFDAPWGLGLRKGIRDDRW